MTRSGACIAILGILLAFSSPVHSQTRLNWKKQKFKAYRVEFLAPDSWNISINASTAQAYIECYSPDNSIYFFITSAENDKKSSPEIVLSYLKVAYTNSEFIREERTKIDGVEFLFSSGINRMNEIQTYIKLGVGMHRGRVYMVDSGFNNVNSDEDEAVLLTIINSIRILD